MQKSEGGNINYFTNLRNNQYKYNLFIAGEAAF
jgi:hypothetical protein